MAPGKRADREGKTQLATWIAKEPVKRVRILAIELERDVSDLLEEAIELLLAKYKGKPK